MKSASNLYRTAFERDNARNIGVRDLSRQFVWTNDFERLLAPKNHIILGARGSGKTALIKMLSHEYLSKLKDPRAEKIIQARKNIGIYVPMKLEWVGGLKNKAWMNEDEAEHFFQWRLNIATCIAFLSAVRSCISVYEEDPKKRVLIELEVARSISQSWLDSPNSSLDEVRIQLEKLEFDKQKQIINDRIRGDTVEPVLGPAFELELFSPLKFAITIVKEALKLPEDCLWHLCLDEAEFLDELHHRILNSHLRSHSGDLVFKITTMPYHHHTLETNTQAPLTIGDDFEYIYIDQPINLDSNSATKQTSQFTKNIFSKRLPRNIDALGLTLTNLLGPSELLGDIEKDWSKRGEMWRLLQKYSSESTFERAESKYGSPAFKDQIARKMVGILILRDALDRHSGRAELDVYSGENVFIRCGDGNPRRIIKLLRNLIESVDFREKNGVVVGFKPLPKKTQNAILAKFSGQFLSLAKLEPKVGADLYELIQNAGDFLHDEISKPKLSTDHFSSIRVDNVSDDVWLLISKAVAKGFLFPNISSGNPDPLPQKSGTFRLAFIFSPYFRIMPRKGKSVSLKRFYNKQLSLVE